jgi:hypothetical protein
MQTVIIYHPVAMKRRDEAPQSLADSENDRLLLVYREFIVPVIHHLPEMLCTGRQRFRSTEACRRIRPAFPEVRLQR